MADTENDPNKSDPTETKPTDEQARAAADQEEADEEEDYDDELLGGFDPEQKRFLWTLSGVLVLGMLLAALAVIWTSNQTHTADERITRAIEDYRDKKELADANVDQLMNGLAGAMARGNKEAVENIQNRIIEMRKEEIDAYAAKRHELGFNDAEPATDEQLQQFAKQILYTAKERLMASGMMTTRPSSRPSSQPAAGEAATQAAGSQP